MAETAAWKDPIVDAIDFNDVLDVFQEFRPRRTIPVEERWRQRFPFASPTQLKGWVKRCKLIEDVAWALAEKVLSGQMSEDQARAELGRRFPELNEDALRRTGSQAMYFASK